MRLPLLIEFAARIPTAEHNDHRKRTYKTTPILHTGQAHIRNKNTL